MRKQLIALASVLGACACLASGEEFSSDTLLDLRLGVTTATITSDKFAAFAVQFTDGTDEGAAIPVSSLITVASPRGASVFTTTADQIWVWKNDEWTKYYYRKGRKVDVPGWCKSGETTVTTDTIGVGETFFFRRGTGNAADSVKVALSGRVVTLGSSESTVEASKMAFLSYPWPIAFSLDGITYKDGSPAGGSALSDATDQVWVWSSESSTWTKYYYNSTVNGWAIMGSAEKTTDSIPVGVGFFFKRASGVASATVTFAKPNGL